MATRKRSRSPRRAGGRRSASPGWLVVLLAVSLLALGGSLWLLYQEKEKDGNRSLTQKALRLADEHPDAEVFQVDDAAPAEQKKK